MWDNISPFAQKYKINSQVSTKLMAVVLLKSFVDLFFLLPNNVTVLWLGPISSNSIPWRSEVKFDQDKVFPYVINYSIIREH